MTLTEATRETIVRLRESDPDLVPEHYWDPIADYLTGVVTTQHEAADLVGEDGVSQQSFARQLSLVRQALTEEPGDEDEMISRDAIANILANAKKVKVDPFALLPEKGEKGADIARIHQRRRAPRTVDERRMAESILIHGIVNPPVVQAARPENDHRQVLIDGFGRLRWWKLANEMAEGTTKRPAIDFPVCDVVNCTNEQAALLHAVLNEISDTHDPADRDYTIVRMYELYPDTYTQKRLAEIFDLDKTTISKIIDAWQNSYPAPDKTRHKKVKPEVENPIRKALEERKITTYHARLLASLKQWPEEQERCAQWLLNEVKNSNRTDAYYDNGRFDEGGVSSGVLSSMVSSARERCEDTDYIAEHLKEIYESETMDEEKYEYFRKRFGRERKKREVTKTAMNDALRELGIKKVSPVVEEPPTPTTFREDREPETRKAEKVVEEIEEKPPILPCFNCILAYTKDREVPLCAVHLKPDEDNQCFAQIPGRSMDFISECLYCHAFTGHHRLPVGGEVVRPFADLDISLEMARAQNGTFHSVHALCEMRAEMGKVDVEGLCRTCNNTSCTFLRAAVHFEQQLLERGEGPLTYAVSKCPGYVPAPSIEEVNETVNERVQEWLAKKRVLWNAEGTK